MVKKAAVSREADSVAWQIYVIKLKKPFGRPIHR
jgi:hypothetical protein